MSDLCHDLVGTEPRKRKAEELPEEQRALIDRTGWVLAAGGRGAGGQGCTNSAASLLHLRLACRQMRVPSVPHVWDAGPTAPQPGLPATHPPRLSRRAADDGDEASCSEDEVLDEGMVGHRINAKKQKQRVSRAAGWQAAGSRGRLGCSAGCRQQGVALLSGPAWLSSNPACRPPVAPQEYAAWKEKQLKEGAEAKKKSKEKLTEKKLKQAVLSFAAGSSGGDGSGAGQQAGAAEAAATEAAAAPEQQQQQQQHVAGSGSDSGKDASLAKTVVGSKAGSSRPKGRTPAKAALAQNNS